MTETLDRSTIRAEQDDQLDALAFDGEAVFGIPGTLTLTRLVLPEDLPYDQWRRVGLILRFMERGVQWWLGDWWRFGERAYGEMASQQAQDAVTEMTGYAYSTVTTCAWVADRFESSRRRENLSWSHHREVSGRPAEEQDAWLDRAEQGCWTRAELRAAMKGELPERGGDPAVCPTCGRPLGE